uniref:Uncharacterized protein n=1 Tax=Arundo donax TaxID=35708 RepID=A0A0A9BA43_ARUDO
MLLLQYLTLESHRGMMDWDNKGHFPNILHPFYYAWPSQLLSVPKASQATPWKCFFAGTDTDDRSNQC